MDLNEKTLRDSDHNDSIDISTTTTTTSTIVRPITRWTVFAIIFSFVVNVLIVMTVNMAFIYAMTTHLSNDLKTIITIAVSLFKLAWNSIFRLFLSGCLSVFTGQVERVYDGKFMLPFLLFVSIFNNIIVPCLAVAFISSNCFLYVIIPSPAVSASFSLFECVYELFFYTQETTACAAYTTMTYQTSYQPPFDYNYQCSATLLTSFAGLFVYRFAIGRVLIPMFEVFVLKPLHQVLEQRFGADHHVPNLFAKTLTVIHRPDVVNKRTSSVQEDVFPCRQQIVSIITDLAIMLSFGIIFPPLLIIGCGSLWVSTRVQEIILQRLLNLSRSYPCVDEVIEKVNDSCHHCLTLLVNALQSLSMLLAVFWALFLFDSLGESRGPLVAMGMPIALVIFSIIVAAANKYIKVIPIEDMTKGIVSSSPSDSSSKREIEMQESVDHGSRNTNPLHFSKSQVF
jgi:hypothetical protein